MGLLALAPSRSLSTSWLQHALHHGMQPTQATMHQDQAATD